METWWCVAILFIAGLTHISHGFKLDLKRSENLFNVGSDDAERAAGQPAHGRLFFQDHTPAGRLRVRAGEPFVLDCEAGGSPSPTVHFLRDGNRIIQGDDHDVLDDEARFESTGHLDSALAMAPLRLSSTKARLVLPCLSARDSGEYTCVAETPTQRIATTTILEVVPTKESKSRRKHHRISKHKSVSSLDEENVSHPRKQWFQSRKHKSNKMTDGEDDVCMRKRLGGDGAPARIHMWTSQRLEFEGSNVQLFCRPGGSPSPKVTWYDRNDEEITPDRENYKVLGNGDLLIRNIQWFEHMGLFRCVAENTEGSDEVTTFLYPTAP